MHLPVWTLSWWTASKYIRISFASLKGTLSIVRKLVSFSVSIRQHSFLPFGRKVTVLMLWLNWKQESDYKHKSTLKSRKYLQIQTKYFK